MRREGRLTGYRHDHRRDNADREQYEQYLQDLGFSGPFNLFDLHPRIKISNKPTNHSKDSARCKRSACRSCHFHPASKSLPKTKGIRNKLYNRKYHGSHRACKPHLSLEPSFFDLNDCDPLSDACHALSDEDDTFVDAYGIHRGMHDVQPDVHPHESELGGEDDDDGCSDVDGLNVEQSMDASIADSERCQSTVADHTLLVSQKQSIYGNLSVPDCFDDLTVVSNDHLLCLKPLLLHSEEWLDQEGFPVPCQSISCPNDDDGSSEWCRIERSDSESDKDDWIIC